jgi:hypothetical protein
MRPGPTSRGREVGFPAVSMAHRDGSTGTFVDASTAHNMIALTVLLATCSIPAAAGGSK